MNVDTRGSPLLLAIAVAAATTACFSLLTDTGGLEGTRPADAGMDAAVDGAEDTAVEAPRLDKKYTEVLGRFVGTPTSPLPAGMSGVELGVTV